MINWRSFKAKKAKKRNCMAIIKVQIRSCRFTGDLPGGEYHFAPMYCGKLEVLSGAYDFQGNYRMLS